MNTFDYLDLDGILCRVKPGEFPIRAAEVWDAENKKWLPYEGSLSQLARDGSPMEEDELDDAARGEAE